MFTKVWVRGVSGSGWSHGRGWLVLRALILVAGTIGAPAWPGALGLARADDGAPTPGLRWYPILDKGQLGPAGPALPRNAIDVFTHEVKPRTVHVSDDLVAVDYGPSGVLFNRASGTFSRRLTVVDGWPGARPAVFGPGVPRTSWYVTGPGVVVSSKMPDAALGKPKSRCACRSLPPRLTSTDGSGGHCSPGTSSGSSSKPRSTRRAGRRSSRG